MGTRGVAAVSGMLLTNQSLRYLELSNNDIDDKDMALLSQALAQNKNLPLHSIQLSFNKITCAGVEAFMNAIWGSQTLKEIKLDNNKMQDRGAQLCSVVLGSIALEHLDISFNRVSTVGIKAVMKSISENNSLRILSLSGIPIDQNASKAVSYALAYNQSLMKLYLDSCCVGYSGQRHIVAGIVSNTNVNLRVLTGFQLSGKLLSWDRRAKRDSTSNALSSQLSQRRWVCLKSQMIGEMIAFLALLDLCGFTQKRTVSNIPVEDQQRQP